MFTLEIVERPGNRETGDDVFERLGDFGGSCGLSAIDLRRGSCIREQNILH